MKHNHTYYPLTFLALLAVPCGDELGTGAGDWAVNADAFKRASTSSAFSMMLRMLGCVVRVSRTERNE